MEITLIERLRWKPKEDYNRSEEIYFSWSTIEEITMVEKLIEHEGIETRWKSKFNLISRLTCWLAIKSRYATNEKHMSL